VTKSEALLARRCMHTCRVKLRIATAYHWRFVNRNLCVCHINVSVAQKWGLQGELARTQCPDKPSTGRDFVFVSTVLLPLDAGARRSCGS
jgi:hypothetical protein